MVLKMRCKTSSVYLEGCKVSVSALSLKNTDGTRTPVSSRPRPNHAHLGSLDAGVVLVTDTPWGELELRFDPTTLHGRKGRGVFSAPTTGSDPSRNLMYLWTALSTHGPDLHEWPDNAYSRALLSAAVGTFDPATSRNVLGFDALGFDENGVNRRGFRADGLHVITGTPWGPAGYDIANRSPSGLQRPLSWYDEILDKNPARESYLALCRPVMDDPSAQWEHASCLMHTISRCLGVQPHLAPRGLATLADDLLEHALPALKAGLESLMPHHLHVAEPSRQLAQEVAHRIDAHLDQDELDLDHGIVLSTVKRRLTGRFALPELTGVTNDAVVLDLLANELVRDLRATALLEIKSFRARSA